MPDFHVMRRWRPSAPRYRTIDRDRIVQLLLLSGWAFEVRQNGAGPYADEALQVLERLVGLGLPFRSSVGGTRLFDPVEVINFVKWMGLSDQDPFWRERFVPTGRRLCLSLCPGSGPEAPLTQRPEARPRGFTTLFRRNVNLAGHRPGATLRLRLPLPIEDDVLQDLRVEILQPYAADLDLSFSVGRVEARGAVPDVREVSLAVRCTFTAWPTRPHPGTPSPPADLARYLSPAEGFIQITDRVRLLADHLAASYRDHWQIVCRYWRFVLDQLACGMVHYDEVRAAPAATDWVLETGWFDCQLGSALLAALCRARGIPARLAGGYLLYEVAPTQHHWVEIWLDGQGWTPFDLLAWDLSMAGQDRAWRTHFAGCLDQRMTTQRLPLVFAGPMSVRLPAAWHMLTRQTMCGTETAFLPLASEVPVYSDAVSVFSHDVHATSTIRHAVPKTR